MLLQRFIAFHDYNVQSAAMFNNAMFNNTTFYVSGGEGWGLL